MASGRSESSAQRVERLFDALLTRDGAGGSWLGPLLGAAPRGRSRFGELADAPGWLEAPVAVRTETGRRGAFEFPAAPSHRLLAWYIEHPDELERVEAEVSAETGRLRRALLDDDPPGVRERAQERAYEILRLRAPRGQAWWRFEEERIVDCLLMTDRLVLVIHGAAEHRSAVPATPWFPRRTGLVRDLEAAQRFAAGTRDWGVLTLEPGAEGRERSEEEPNDLDRLDDEIDRGAPHLDLDERRALGEGYLGALTTARAAEVAGLDAAHSA